MGTYQRYPLKIIRGKGCWVWDDKGKRYLDAVAGIATCSLGHSDHSLKRDLRKQLNKIQHVSNLYEIPEQELLAQWLVDHSCADSVFFCNSGAEANEAAIKLARKYGHLKLGIDVPLILSAKASFHGRTLAAVSATGQPKYHKGFEPMVQGFDFFEYNNLSSFANLLEQLTNKGQFVSAVLIEPLQGEGGINPGDPIFFKRLREICTEKKILLILDEVQTGMARTGKLWGHDHLGIEPDAFTLAKGLGGGHPIGALLVNQNANLFTPGDHASTFGGNPFACRAGLTVAKEIINRDILKKVTINGEYLRGRLLEIADTYSQHLSGVRGLGLIQGLVLKEESSLTAQTIVKAAINQNLLVLAAGEKVIRMVPPLVINKKEIDQLVARLKKALHQHC